MSGAYGSDVETLTLFIKPLTFLPLPSVPDIVSVNTVGQVVASVGVERVPVIGRG